MLPMLLRLVYFMTTYRQLALFALRMPFGKASKYANLMPVTCPGRVVLTVPVLSAIGLVQATPCLSILLAVETDTNLKRELGC